MQPQYRSRRRGAPWVVWLMPVLLVCCLGAVLLAPAIPGVILQFVGFTPKGDVNTFWQRQSVQMTPFEVVPGIPAISTAAGGDSVAVPGQPGGLGGAAGETDVDYTTWFTTYTVPGALNVNSAAGAYTVDTADTYAQTAWFGEAADGFPLGIIEYREDALRGICATWLQGCETDQFSVSAVDFRINGVVVSGQANVGGIVQPVGLVLTLGSDMKSFLAQGVVIGGQLYAVPTTGDIAVLVTEAVTRSNELLSDFRVTTSGMSVGLVQIRITDSTLALVFR